MLLHLVEVAHTYTESPTHRRVHNPHELRGHEWVDVARRVWHQIGADRLSLASAGVAFYAFLSVFPAIVAVTTIWGLVADASEVESQLGSFSSLLPAAGRDLLTDQAIRIASSSGTTLGFGTAVALGVTLWSARKGLDALMQGVNVAYNIDEKRGLVHGYALTLLLTLGGIVMAVIAILLVVAVPWLLAYVGFEGLAGMAVGVIRWPLLAGMVLVALAILYRIAPVTHDPGWRWVAPGAVLATALWLVASIGFSYYVSNINSYDRFYGSIAAVAILLVWFYISAFMVLLGAEINAEIERHSTKDRELRR